MEFVGKRLCSSVVGALCPLRGKTPNSPKLWCLTFLFSLKAASLGVWVGDIYQFIRERPAQQVLVVSVFPLSASR